MGLFDFVKEKIKETIVPPAQPQVGRPLQSVEAPVQPQPDRTLKKEDFKVAGAHYYSKNIGKLANRNQDWKLTGDELAAAGRIMQKVFRYNYINKPVKLIPEPTNPHDRNAVQVVVAGELVGYISSSENCHVIDILRNHEVKYITAKISGGEYKVASGNGDVVKLDERIGVNVRIGYV